MDAKVPFHSSQRTEADTLRQRQRDRLIPRGRLTKESQSAATATDAQDVLRQKFKVSLVPRPKVKGVYSPVRSQKRPKQDEMRDDDPYTRAAREAVGDVKVDVTPESTSAGREGRQFAVANVGNNGKIYLRPTVRAANQRYPQPPFVFPITPPSTAGFETLMSLNSENGSQRESVWTGTPSSPTTNQRGPGQGYFARSKPAVQPGRERRRALSQSTLDEYTPMEDSDQGAFKVVIERPRTEGQPKTAEDLGGIPTLEVKIPSYKLGTPRFSTRGTAMLRNSSYTTDDIRSSVWSQSHRDLSTARNTLRPDAHSIRRHSYASSRPRYLASEPSPTVDAPPLPTPSIAAPCGPIAPAMFDQLTFTPDRDSRSLVRYAVGGSITAATPPRLVSEITSPCFLDYDLLSDFFLTFRSFLATSDLLGMLVARLRWALARKDEVGMIVRVRAFVAMRHWILNYFMDDFVVDYELRKGFCELVNDFVNELLQNPATPKNKLKILAELKKCWRRACALYWDGPEFSADVEPNAPIAPGGIAGSRDPHLTPSFWEPADDVGPPRLENVFEYDNTGGGYNFFADVSRAGHIGSVVTPEPVVEAHSDTHQDPPMSPTSIFSNEVISCSFPTKSKTAQMGSEQPLAAHPVPLPASSWYDSSLPVAHTPKGLTIKRRPTHTHKRSGSFSDSMRDGRCREPVQTVVYKSTDLLLSLPYAGSLVRGNLIPPGHAFVDVVAPATPSEHIRQLGSSPVPTSTSSKGPSAMSGPGMKKLIGSVRRVLGTRSGWSPCESPTQGSFPHIPPLGVRGATVNRLPGTAVVPQARRRDAEGRNPVRIDLLGAGIAEDFKKAVREDAEADVERRKASTNGSIGVASGNEAMYPSAQPPRAPEASNYLMPRSPLSGISGGSKSIVIVDDTLPFELPVMTAALPQNPSTDTFTDAFMPTADPTPPITPPGQHMGSPRRSSHLLGQNTYGRNRSLSLDRTPSLINDNRDQSTIDRSPSYRRVVRPSMMSFGRSNKSTSLRRYASFQSGFTRHMTERSFDATTVSDNLDRMSIANAPAAPHVLRRRPGGDLRAVNNVGDLNNLPLRRTRSFGSITTRTDSMQSSYVLTLDPKNHGRGTINNDPSRDNTGTFSLGALAEIPANPKLSLFSTHSSKPAMRPSFEAEAAKLAQIPDDTDDDGGVESALLKLEGKFDEHRRSQSSGVDATRSTPQSQDLSSLREELDHADDDENIEKRKHRQQHVIETSTVITEPQLEERRAEPTVEVEELKPTVYQPEGFQLPIQSIQSLRSEESYSSIPILQRDLSDDGYVRMDNRTWRDNSILRDASEERKPQGEHLSDSSHPSISFIDDASLQEAPFSGEAKMGGSVDASFLNSDSDGGSDLSSELSLEIISRTEITDDGHTTSFPPIRSGTVITEVALPAHPLRQPSSPSMTMGQALSLDPHPTSSPQLYQNQLEFQPYSALPPTPEVTPILPDSMSNPHIEDWDDGAQSAPVRPSSNPYEASRKTCAHLPFILAFDSEILAQQFTLIEKDALAEIDWKELIDMRWKNTVTTSRSWVDFLRTQEARGVEVVIARFNIMVKWAVSECVLTQNLEERVQTFRKYIHIAAHCRRYRNYATMYQLTVALTSSEVARLTKTWSLVPAADLETLRELETLVQPTRNFYFLRQEMECGGVDNGCIPFIGIYTQDLLFNSQRPSQIASTPTTEPLVNFERCRTMAAIVKNLLRLLEASSQYQFQPIEGITERCLWMAALNDEEIRKCGHTIE